MQTAARDGLLLANMHVRVSDQNGVRIPSSPRTQAIPRNFHLPRLLDIPLRALKHLLLALFAYAVASMPVVAIRQFLETPYGIVDDVKMRNFFRELETIRNRRSMRFRLPRPRQLRPRC